MLLSFHRTYHTGSGSKLSSIIQQNISIGKFLQTTNRSCPHRNQILGEKFCQFALKLTLYTTACERRQQHDRNQLHQQYHEGISKLELQTTPSKNSETEQIRLPSTGKFLTGSVNESLNRWRQKGFDEVWDACKQVNKPSDESVAERVRDINFSLIGWYLQTYGMQKTLAFLQWLGVPLFSDPDKLEWPEISPLLAPNNQETRRKINSILDGYDAHEQKIKYEFRNKAYLLQSVTHESFTANDLTPSYYGMDFVGDAIMNYALVRHLFRQPDYLNADDLGCLSQLLSCNSSIATVAMRNDLHKYLRYTTPTIRDSINSFGAFLQRNKFKPINDLYFLDRKNFVFEIPEIVSDSFESLIAAIFLDSQKDLNAVTNTILHLMAPDIRTICRTKPKTAFDELWQLDAGARFSEPVMVGAGQIKVEVTLPNFQNKKFSAISRASPLAKWGAAKAAVMHLKHQRNVFIQTSHNEMLKKYENNIRQKELSAAPKDVTLDEQQHKDQSDNTWLRNQNNSFRMY